MSGQTQQQQQVRVTISEENALSERVEQLLWVLYAGSAIASLVSMICLLIVWQHWTWTFDSCINFDCGCILYGVNTFSTFMGGEAWLCHFGSFGLVFNLIFGLLFALYHGYRSCIPRSLSEPRALATNRSYQNRRSMECEVMVVKPKQRAPFKRWMVPGFTAFFMAAMALVHAAVLTDGYYKTCSQYRRHLAHLINPIGQELLVIHNRLSCGAILDFMDYLQPDSTNWRRPNIIDSGLILQISILASWINFVAWATIFGLNVYMSRRRRKMRNEPNGPAE